MQGQTCTCPGKIRWGNFETWMTLDLKPGDKTQSVECSVRKLKDVLPGDSGKHCDCAAQPGTPFFENLNPGLLPDDNPIPRPPLMASCDMFEAAANYGDIGVQYWIAMEPFCSEAWQNDPARASNNEKAGSDALSFDVLRNLANAWVDPRFVEQHKRLYDASGWLQRGFVNYYAGPPDGKHAKMTEELIVSVHEFSSEAVVVVHFGTSTNPKWTPERFPRLILLHAAPMPPSSGRSFNFNKMRAMLLTRISTGVQLDSDQFVAPGVDAIFPSTEREVTKYYPFPILPAHFLDRTPRDLGRYWERYCPKMGKCLFQTQRWGHAHPTYTFWGIPFIARWLRRNLRDETLPPRENGKMIALRVKHDVPEDEDLLNVATWEEGGTKQWCKLDLPGPEDFEALLAAKEGDKTCRGGSCGDITKDPHWHPHGVAKVFYTAHHAVNPEVSANYIKRLKELKLQNNPIMYQGHFYSDGAELRKTHPEITCII